MNKKESPGTAMHDPDAERRREAARAMGQARTERKTQQSAQNIQQLNKRRKTEGFSEETKLKLKAAQALRREREKAEHAALVSDAAPVAPRPKERPKKSDVQTQEPHGNS